VTLRLTRAGVAFATAGFGLFALGVAMANLDLLLLASLPLLLVAAALATAPRADPAGARVPATRAPRRGDALDVRVAMRGGPARGITEVHAPLPASFALEQGSNLALATGERLDVAMRVRPHARGRHELGPVTAESIDPAGVAAPVARTFAAPLALEVQPRRQAMQRLRARSPPMRWSASEGQAEQEEARLGVDSTDFRELRDYAWGDPPNSINWKATARRLSALGRRGGRHSAPVVNEYEKEGKRTVFVLLDGGAPLRVGTTLESGLDHGAEAALAAARYFLARGARVGAWTYGCRGGPLAPPDAGSSQVPSLERALSPGEADEDATLPLALRQAQRYLSGGKPLVVIVTRVTPERAPEIVEAARHLRALARVDRGRSATPLLVLDVRALRLAPTPAPAWRAARDLVERQDERAARGLAAAGVRVLPWRVGEEDLRKALLRGGLT
jgi:uncharacterized protein (DUF58 family)